MRSCRPRLAFGMAAGSARRGFKIGTSTPRLAHKDQTDVANAWQAMCKRVRSYRDLDPAFNREVERLIDFVTQDQPGAET